MLFSITILWVCEFENEANSFQLNWSWYINPWQLWPSIYGNLCGQYGIQRTSTLYANSSGPRISTIRPSAARSTPTVSLNPGFLEVDEVFLEGSLPVDDIGSGTRTLH